MPGKRLSCALLADRHHGLTEGVRGLLETTFGTVAIVANEARAHELAKEIGSSEPWMGSPVDFAVARG